MADVAQKARYNLERCIPRLREWEEREIFTKEEIRAIVQKLDAFEYKVLSPGNTAADYLDYAVWEQTLDTLRKKRCRRLKIRHVASQHAGQVRVLKIYQRGTQRHPGSSELWTAYLDYAARIRAKRRWRKIATQALRMMPLDAALWVRAGRQCAADEDMNAARVFFMRGCRFCSQDETLWVAYARCEMEWLRRVAPKTEKTGAGEEDGEEGRRRQSKALQSAQAADDDEIRFSDGEDDEDEMDGGDMVLLPEPAVRKPKKVFTDEEQNTLAEKSNPAMHGAIPQAIYDVASKQGFFSPSAAAAFFDLFSSFIDVAAHERLSQHVLDTMMERYPDHTMTWSCFILQPIRGVAVQSADFARGLREVLVRLKTGLASNTDVPELKNRISEWMAGALEAENLDEGVRTVLEVSKRRLNQS